VYAPATRRLPVGPSVPLLMVPDEQVAAEINAAAHVIRQSLASASTDDAGGVPHFTGAYLANCFVGRLGNCIGVAADCLSTVHHHVTSRASLASHGSPALLRVFPGYLKWRSPIPE